MEPKKTIFGVRQASSEYYLLSFSTTSSVGLVDTEEATYVLPIL